MTANVISEGMVERMLDEAETVLAPYVQGDGSIEFDSPGHIVSATRS